MTISLHINVKGSSVLTGILNILLGVVPCEIYDSSLFNDCAEKAQFGCIHYLHDT